MNMCDSIESQIDEVSVSTEAVSMPLQLMCDGKERQCGVQETDRRILDFNSEKMERLFKAFEEVFDEFDKARNYTTPHDECHRSFLTAPAKSYVTESHSRIPHYRSQSDNHNDRNSSADEFQGVTTHKFVSRMHGGRGPPKADPRFRITRDTDLTQAQVPKDVRDRLKQDGRFLQFQDLMYGYLRAQERKKEILESRMPPSTSKKMEPSPPHFRDTGMSDNIKETKIDGRTEVPHSVYNTIHMPPTAQTTPNYRMPVMPPGVHKTTEMPPTAFRVADMASSFFKSPEISQPVHRTPQMPPEIYRTPDMTPSVYKTQEPPQTLHKTSEIPASDYRSTGAPDMLPASARLENYAPGGAGKEMIPYRYEDKEANSKCVKVLDGSENPAQFAVYTLVTSSPRDITVKNLIKDDTEKSGFDGRNFGVKGSQYVDFPTVTASSTFERQSPTADKSKTFRSTWKTHSPERRDKKRADDERHFDEPICSYVQSLSCGQAPKSVRPFKDISCARRERMDYDKHYVHSKLVTYSPYRLKSDWGCHVRSSPNRYCPRDECRRDHYEAIRKPVSKSADGFCRPRNFYEPNFKDYSLCCGSDTAVARMPYSTSRRFQTKSASHLYRKARCPLCYLENACRRIGRCQQCRFQDRLDCTSPCCFVCNSVNLGADFISKVYR